MSGAAGLAAVCPVSARVAPGVARRRVRFAATLRVAGAFARFVVDAEVRPPALRAFVPARVAIVAPSRKCRRIRSDAECGAPSSAGVTCYHGADGSIECPAAPRRRVAIAARAMISHEEVILRLVIAAALGSIIGIERERLAWVAGLRTHMLVCVGSALMMIVSAFGFGDVLGHDHIVLDP